MIEFYVLFVAIMVAMSQVWQIPNWNQNLHLILAQNISWILHKNDCWVCTQMPRHPECGIPLAGVPLPSQINWTKAGIWKNTISSKYPTGKYPTGKFPELNVTTLIIPNMSFP